jgi:hypothetical protein
VALADLLDPGRLLRRNAEEWRVEAMLSAEECQAMLLTIEKMIALVVAVLAWLRRFLFGGPEDEVIESSATERPLATPQPNDEPPGWGPAPC